MKTEQNNTRFSPADSIALADMAKAEGVTRSEILRRALRRYAVEKLDGSMTEVVRSEVRAAFIEFSNILGDDLKKTLTLIVEQQQRFFDDLRAPGSAKPAPPSTTSTTKYGSLR